MLMPCKIICIASRGYHNLEKFCVRTFPKKNFNASLISDALELSENLLLQFFFASGQPQMSKMFDVLEKKTV